MTKIDAPFLTCPHCLGQGWADDWLCDHCDGTGVIYIPRITLQNRMLNWWVENVDWKIRLVVSALSAVALVVFAVMIVLWIARLW